MCFIRISEQAATFTLYLINWLVFVTEVESVYYTVHTESLYKTDIVSSLKGYFGRVATNCCLSLLFTKYGETVVR
jgi:hypothetical protein